MVGCYHGGTSTNDEQGKIGLLSQCNGPWKAEMSNIVRGSSKKGKMVILHTEIYFENCFKRGSSPDRNKVPDLRGKGVD